jgi:hypothetical protein
MVFFLSLADGLRKNKSLECLGVSFTQFGEEGMNALVGCFSENFSLCCVAHVDMTGEEIEKEWHNNHVENINKFLTYNKKSPIQSVFVPRGIAAQRKLDVFTERNKQLKLNQ